MEINKTIGLVLSLMALMLFSGCQVGNISLSSNHLDQACIDRGYNQVTDWKYDNSYYEHKYANETSISTISIECDNLKIFKNVEFVSLCKNDKWGDCSGSVIETIISYE